MWGRENPPLEREVDVAQFGPRELAITWRGASCDANTALVVEGTRDALHIMVDRGLTKGCSGTDVIYDSVLELAAAVGIDDIRVQAMSRDRSAGDR